MSLSCRHLHAKGYNKGQRCGEKVSKLDPENRYCAKHRICVFLIKPKEKPKIEKEMPKYINYLTFCESIVSDSHDIQCIKEIFELQI
jgi:hypothetical protein